LLAGTILFYVVVYTAWLKRATRQNIVIGGAAGALPPVIGWAACTGTVDLPPLVLFLIIFLTVVARLEKRMVWAYGNPEAHRPYPDPSGYGGRWVGDALNEGGFSFLGWASDLKGPRYQVSYALFCCADGQVPLYFDVYEGNRNDSKQFPLLLNKFTATSCIGTGLAATLESLFEQRSGLKRCEFETVDIKTHIGEVPGIDDQRLPENLLKFDCRNNRLAELALQQDQFLEAVQQAAKRWGRRRVGVCIGTSTAGILQTELAYRARDPVSGALPSSFEYGSTHNSFSVADYLRRRCRLEGPAVAVSCACASSAKVFGSARRMIEAGLVDAALVGGVDSLCLTTLYGFHSLQLSSPGPCRPFDVARDGISVPGRLVHQLGERRDPRPRILGRVEAVHQIVHAGGAGCLEQRWAKSRGRPPPLFLPQSRAHRLPHQIERAALVAERVPPAARARRPPLGIPAKRDRAGSRDRDHARLARGRAHQGDHCVVRNRVFLRVHQIADQRFLVGRPAAQAQARCFEVRLGDSRFLKRGPDSSAHRFGEPGPCFGRAHVVARPAAPHSGHPSGLVTDQSSGARLPPIHA
jgi:hypothetical protein